MGKKKVKKLFGNPPKMPKLQKLTKNYGKIKIKKKKGNKSVPLMLKRIVNLWLCLRLLWQTY